MKEYYLMIILLAFGIAFGFLMTYLTMFKIVKRQRMVIEEYRKVINARRRHLDDYDDFN